MKNFDDDLMDWIQDQDVNLKNNTELVANEVAAAVSDNKIFSETLMSYKLTAKYIEKMSKKHKFDYCCIKAIRVYSHFNTDLNIVIQPTEFKRVISLLEADGWSRRSKWSQFKENVAEHGKRKLVNAEMTNISEIHLYPGLSWHGSYYASADHVLRDTQYIEFGIEVKNNGRCFDLLSNIGHAFFERFKFTAGEVFHISSILQNCSTDDIEKAREIAKYNGWESGFCDGLGLISELRSRTGQSYPVFIHRKVLWKCWRERFIYHLKHGAPVRGCLEILFNWIWSGPVYHFYSSLKRTVTGETAFDKKYKDLS